MIIVGLLLISAGIVIDNLYIFSAIIGFIGGPGMD
jgi:hypothetical protein